MEKDKESITLSSSDESSNMSELDHILIHEDPLSPVESTVSEPKNDLLILKVVQALTLVPTMQMLL